MITRRQAYIDKHTILWDIENSPCKDCETCLYYENKCKEVNKQ